MNFHLCLDGNLYTKALTLSKRFNIDKNVALSYTSYFLKNVKSCEVCIAKLKDNVSTSGMNSFSRAFRYVRSPCVRMRSTVWVVYGQTATDLANNKDEKLIKKHCLPLELSLNCSWRWKILPLTNKVEFDIIKYLPNTEVQTKFLMRDVLPAIDRTIIRAQNYSDMSKFSNREFCWYSNIQIAPPQLRDFCCSSSNGSQYNLHVLPWP